MGRCWEISGHAGMEAGFFCPGIGRTFSTLKRSCAVSGKKDFAFPYWDWVKNPTMPGEFFEFAAGQSGPSRSTGIGEESEPHTADNIQA